MKRTQLIVCVALSLGFGTRAVSAESGDALGPVHEAGVLSLRVDILDPESESIVLSSDTFSSMVVSGPDQAPSVAVLEGQVFSPPAAGAYTVEFPAPGVARGWDVKVMKNGQELRGRVASNTWFFNSPGGLNASLYALVNTGAPGQTGVIEVRFNGLSGGEWSLTAGRRARRTGTVGNPRSGPGPLSLYVAPEVDIPLYLQAPSIATYTAVLPGVGEARFGTPLCSATAARAEGSFNFTATTDGTFHIVCDLNRDDVFSLTDDDDLHVMGLARSGANQVSWDGLHHLGTEIPAGDYSCRVQVMVGELHVTINDAETSYLGLRMFAQAENLSLSGLPMFWNDADVAGGAVAMPNGQTSRLHTPASGLDSQTPIQQTRPDVNARAWGNFANQGRGDEALMNTYTFLDRGESETFTLTILDNRSDPDGDGLGDHDECRAGLAADDPDTDGDTIDDFAESKGGRFVDTDGDGEQDGIDDDADGDGILDEHEAGDQELATPPVDTDGDLSADFRDEDSDGDGLSDAAEAGDRLPETPPVDTDGDGVEDFRDLDSDGDRVEDGVDNCPRVANADQSDIDGDGIGDLCANDYADTDVDGISDALDNCPEVSNPDQGDLDRDGVGDACAPGGGCSASGGSSAAGALWVLLVFALGRRFRTGILSSSRVVGIVSLFVGVVSGCADEPAAVVPRVVPTSGQARVVAQRGASVYWLDSRGLMTVNVDDGTPPEQIALVPAFAHVVLQGDTIYASGPDCSLLIGGLHGGGLESLLWDEIAPSLDCPDAFTVDDDAVYTVSRIHDFEPERSRNVVHRIERVALRRAMQGEELEPTVLGELPQPGPELGRLAQDRRYLYSLLKPDTSSTDGAQLLRIDKSGAEFPGMSVVWDSEHSANSLNVAPDAAIWLEARRRIARHPTRIQRMTSTDQTPQIVAERMDATNLVVGAQHHCWKEPRGKLVCVGEDGGEPRHVLTIGEHPLTGTADYILWSDGAMLHFLSRDDLDGAGTPVFHVEPGDLWLR